MSMLKWAEQECRIACKKENPDFNFDSNDFDYGCSCYKSALKAYKSLCEDDHSGVSFNFTRRILEQLMSGNPLTPITDEDFKGVSSVYSDENLASRGLKSEIQCPRMSSLFRMETLDGKVSYRDINRAYCIDSENPSDTFSSVIDKVVDEFFPITMPYLPEKGKYKVYVQSFLVDERNGDFDTRGILYIETPKGEIINIEKYQTVGNGEWIDISKEKYYELLSKSVESYTKNGTWWGDGLKGNFDLFFAPEKKVGWMNLYKKGFGLVKGGDVYNSEEAAKKIAAGDEDYITTIKIEWEG